uniref:Uncharacterized protein n=1 Tax=Arundo donax TaxID=35708 RepID=A0A0A8Z7C7_ARUDO
MTGEWDQRHVGLIVMSSGGTDPHSSKVAKWKRKFMGLVPDLVVYKETFKKDRGG